MQPAQAAVIERLAREVAFFVEEGCGRVPDVDWKRVLSAKKVGYSGEVVIKGLDLTCKQVEPTLPPEGYSGKLPATELAAAGLIGFDLDAFDTPAGLEAGRASPAAAATALDTPRLPARDVGRVFGEFAELLYYTTTVAPAGDGSGDRDQ